MVFAMTTSKPTENKFREFSIARDLAHKEICKLAESGARSWSLSIPPQSHDSDMVLQNALDTADAAVEQLKAELAKEIEQRDEISALKARLLDFEGMTFSENTEISKLREQVKDYEQALEFYGDRGSWDWYVTCEESENLHILKEDCEDLVSTELDSNGKDCQNNLGSFGGKKAREVLKKWSGV